MQETPKRILSTKILKPLCKIFLASSLILTINPENNNVSTVDLFYLCKYNAFKIEHSTIIVVRTSYI